MGNAFAQRSKSDREGNRRNTRPVTSPGVYPLACGEEKSIPRNGDVRVGNAGLGSTEQERRRREREGPAKIESGCKGGYFKKKREGLGGKKELHRGGIGGTSFEWWRRREIGLLILVKGECPSFDGK